MSLPILYLSTIFVWNIKILAAQLVTFDNCSVNTEDEDCTDDSLELELDNTKFIANTTLNNSV